MTTRLSASHPRQYRWAAAAVVFRCRVVCWWIGHRPVGPMHYAPTRHPLEPYIYLCERCIRPIRFSREYPNGWVIVEIE